MLRQGQATSSSRYSKAAPHFKFYISRSACPTHFNGLTLPTSRPFHLNHLATRETAKMTELSFAKSFLTTLDAKPSKISAEHVEDPKTYPARGAVRPSFPSLLPCPFPYPPNQTNKHPNSTSSPKPLSPSPKRSVSHQAPNSPSPSP
jgi:hypothetical protein